MFKNSLLHWISSFYTMIITAGGKFQSLFLFYMRITWGYQFFILGLAKLGNIEPLSDLFSSLAIPAPLLNAYLIALLETLCGFMLFIGLGSRLAALPLIIMTLVALSAAHPSNLSELHFLLQPQSLAKEAPYPFLITSVLIFIFGPGRLSLDAWIKRWAEQQPKY